MNIEEVKIKALPILRRAKVVRSSVFGSVARGEARDNSDIDLLVELTKDKSLLDLVDLKMRLEERLGKKVDITTYRAISPRLQKFIRRDEVRIL